VLYNSSLQPVIHNLRRPHHSRVHSQQCRLHEESSCGCAQAQTAMQHIHRERARMNSWIHRHFTSKRSLINGCKPEAKLTLESDTYWRGYPQDIPYGSAHDPKILSISTNIYMGTLERSRLTRLTASFLTSSISWTMEIAWVVPARSVAAVPASYPRVHPPALKRAVPAAFPQRLLLGLLLRNA